MGYHHVDPADVEPEPDRDSTRRSLSAHVGLENLGLNLYDIAPGEQAPLRYHYHTEQEEVFYVLDGVLHVETETGTHEVGAGELFAIEPNSPQRAFNPADADTSARTLAIGAPSVDDYHFPGEE